MVAEWKKEEIKGLKEMIDRYPVIGIVDFFEVPSKQVQQIRNSIEDIAEIRMSRKTLIMRALKKSEKEGLRELEEGMGKMPALICSNKDPFKLAKVLRENTQKAKAKPGTIASYDIKVSPGPTSFKPGPVLSKFSSLGIPTDVEEGKIVIQEETTIVPEGEKVDNNAANLLTKLGIKPREVGLALQAAWEEGEIYTKEKLKIDPEAWIDKLEEAKGRAMNLAISTEIFNRASIRNIIRNAMVHAKSLNNIIENSSVGD